MYDIILCGGEKMDKLYTVNEVSEILNVHPNTIRLWIKDKSLKAVKVGKQWRVKEIDLQGFIKEQEGAS